MKTKVKWSQRRMNENKMERHEKKDIESDWEKVREGGKASAKKSSKEIFVCLWIFLCVDIFKSMLFKALASVIVSTHFRISFVIRCACEAHVSHWNWMRRFLHIPSFFFYFFIVMLLFFIFNLSPLLLVVRSHAIFLSLISPLALASCSPFYSIFALLSCRWFLFSNSGRWLFRLCENMPHQKYASIHRHLRKRCKIAGDETNALVFLSSVVFFFFYFICFFLLACFGILRTEKRRNVFTSWFSLFVELIAVTSARLSLISLGIFGYFFRLIFSFGFSFAFLFHLFELRLFFSYIRVGVCGLFGNKF